MAGKISLDSGISLPVIGKPVEQLCVHKMTQCARLEKGQEQAF